VFVLSALYEQCSPESGTS